MMVTYRAYIGVKDIRRAVEGRIVSFADKSKKDAMNLKKDNYCGSCGKSPLIAFLVDS
jgi:hypothetical protein